MKFQIIINAEIDPSEFWYAHYWNTQSKLHKAVKKLLQDCLRDHNEMSSGFSAKVAKVKTQ